MGKHTLTGMLTANGQQFMDWSPAYRLFSKQRVDTSKLFEVARSEVLQELGSEQMIVAHLDDTILKKTGKKIPGTAWRRDPLGPRFQTNFIWGQRFLQISLALPDHHGCCQSRAIPVDFHHCPTVKKPRKNAEEQDWKNYREQQRKLKLSKQGVERVIQLRNDLDKQGAIGKQLIVSVDGSYTNEQVLKNLPEGVTLIGRIRKDSKLYSPPENQSGKGRKRFYGERLPTPEEIRQSDQCPTQEVIAFATGKEHKFKVKVIKNVLWRSAGQKHKMQLVVIKPLGYRLTKKSKMLYREPAYLICTDNELDLDKLLQSFLWRWEIEVNFREEKTVMGCGEAQVRNPESVVRIPAFISAVYALVHIAAYRYMKKSNCVMLPRPKWYLKKDNQRNSTGDILNNFRAQAYAKSIGMNFSGFVNQEINSQSHKNFSNPITSAMFYARN